MDKGKEKDFEKNERFHRLRVFRKERKFEIG
jgi:hypothetical protein